MKLNEVHLEFYLLQVHQIYNSQVKHIVSTIFSPAPLILLNESYDTPKIAFENLTISYVWDTYSDKAIPYVMTSIGIIKRYN